MNPNKKLIQTIFKKTVGAAILIALSAPLAHAAREFACYPQCVVMSSSNNQLLRVEGPIVETSRRSRSSAFRAALRQCQWGAEEAGYGRAVILARELHLSGTTHSSRSESDAPYWPWWATRYSRYEYSSSHSVRFHRDDDSSFDLEIFTPADCAVERVNDRETPEYEGRERAYP